MISRLFSIAMAATLAAIPAAATNPSEVLDAGHLSIVRAASDAGVSFKVNADLCRQFPKFYGMYDGKQIIICLRQGHWTTEELDTLRHEAQHLVQDCLGDGKPNFRFNGRYLVFPNIAELAPQILSERLLGNIVMNYHDASRQEFLMELEAFMVAQEVAPEEIASAINNHCRAR